MTSLSASAAPPGYTGLMTHASCPQTFLLSPLERALLRRLVLGCALEDAARAVGLPLPDIQATLQALQARAGADGLPRLLTLAILNSWV